MRGRLHTKECPQLEEGKEVGTSTCQGNEVCSAHRRQPGTSLSWRGPRRERCVQSQRKGRGGLGGDGVGSVRVSLAVSGWFEAVEFTITVLEARRPKSRCQQSPVPSEGAREDLFQGSLLASGSGRRSELTDASLQWSLS